MTHLMEYRENLRHVGNPKDVQSALEDTLANLGFEQSCYLIFRPPSGYPTPNMLTNFPEEWKARYIDQDYGSVDALVPEAVQSLFPLRWDKVYSKEKSSKKQRQLFDEASSVGLKSGITVPIHGPAGGMALISMCGDLSDREFNQIWGLLRDELTLIAASTHEAMLNCVSRETSLEPVSLTERERQCLLWTARGKTAWEVSSVLGITERTVLFHLNNSMAKLRVFSKHHAVVKAIMLGLILP